MSLGSKKYVQIFSGLIMLQLLIFGAVALYSKTHPKARVSTIDTAQSIDLNKRAWEGSFTERGLAVPPQGPREGYWGSRLLYQTFDEATVWRMSEQVIPGLVAIDAHGFQHATSTAREPVRLLIVGSSVASGAYASDEAHTYYTALQKILAQRGLDVSITVVSAGAWKTEQIVKALFEYYDAVNPDAVMFINGLNSLTVGSSAHTRYSERVATADGSEWSLLYHEYDYDERAKVFLENMAKAFDFMRTKGKPFFVVMQPAIFDKTPRSDIENEIVYWYENFLGPQESLQESYAAMSRALSGLVGRNAYYKDLSGAFNGETATTFTDMWHFSDPAHLIFANELADFIYPILKK